MARALYPGTFDPIHNGHIDIAVRASVLFDEVIVAVYDAPPKKLLFDTADRYDLARAALPVAPPALGYERWMALMARDKKVAAGTIRFVLLEALGRAVLGQDVPDEVLRAVLP